MRKPPVWILAIASSFCLGGIAADKAKEPTVERVKRMYRDTVLANRDRLRCAIAVPNDSRYAELGQKVQARIRECVGQTAPIVKDPDPASLDKTQSWILLGNMTNSRLAYRLYVQRYIVADWNFPGAGGYVVRTVHDPWGVGSNVVLLGGSDLAGVARAVKRFVEMLQPAKTLIVPKLMEIEFSGKELLTAEQLARARAVQRREFVEKKALWYGATYRLIDFANLYYTTGIEDYARIFTELAQRWIKEYRRWAPERQITTPKYAMPWLILAWDLVEESRAVPNGLRIDMTNLLYDYVRRMSRHGRVANWQEGQVRVTGHYVCLSVLYGARYFKKYYAYLPMGEIDAGLADIATGMATLQNTPAVLSEDGYCHFHPDTITHYALAMDDLAFFRSGNARRWCEYSALCTTNRGRFFGGWTQALPVAAWLYREPWIAWVDRRTSGRPPTTPRVINWKLVYSPWRFSAPAEQTEPAHLLGVRSFPIDGIVYSNLTRNEEPPSVPIQRAFRQIAFRASFDPSKQFLLLDGVNIGLHKRGDGNAVRSFEDKGTGFLVSGRWGATEMKFQSTLLVIRDGRGPDGFPALCSLDCIADGSRVGFAQSRYAGFNGIDWTRSVVWAKGRYFMFFDHARARDSADYALFCQWRTGGKAEMKRGTYTAKRQSTTLVIDNADEADGIVAPEDGNVHVARYSRMGTLRRGETYSFVNLLYTRHNSENAYGWTRFQSDETTAFRDVAAFASGRACLCLKTRPIRGWQAVRQSLPDPTPGAAYRLTVSAKTNGIVPARAYVRDATTRRVIAKIDVEETEWSRRSVEFVAPPADHTVEAWLVPGQYAVEGGTVWFDDVAVVPAEDGPNMLVNGGFEQSGETGQSDEWTAHRVSPNAVAVSDGEQIALVGSSPDITDLSVDGVLQAHARAFYAAPGTLAIAQGTSARFGSARIDASNPISFDFEWAGGRGVAITGQQTRVAFGPVDRASLRVDGRSAAPTSRGDLAEIDLPRGRHVVEWTPHAQTVEAVIAELRRLTRPLLTAETKTDAPPKREPVSDQALWSWRVPDADGASITAVDVGDLDGDEKPEYVVGASDGRIWILSSDGKEIAEATASKAVNDLLIAELTPGARPVILAASDDFRVHCLDSDGERVWSFDSGKAQIKNQIPGEYGTGRHIEAAGEFITLKVGDLDGDEKPEVVAGATAFVHGKRRVFGTLFVLNAKGKELWHVYQSGGWPESVDLADLDGDGTQEIALASGGPTYGRANYIIEPPGVMRHRFGDPYGPSRTCFAFAGERREPKMILADARSGVIRALQAVPPYRQEWSFNTGGLGATCLAAVDLDNRPGDEIVVGSENGSVYAFSLEGKSQLLWRRTVAAPVSALAVVRDDRGPALVVGTAAGRIVWISASGAATRAVDAADGVAISNVVAAPTSGVAVTAGPTLVVLPSF